MGEQPAAQQAAAEAGLGRWGTRKRSQEKREKRGEEDEEVVFQVT